MDIIVIADFFVVVFIIIVVVMIIVVVIRLVAVADLPPSLLLATRGQGAGGRILTVDIFAPDSSHCAAAAPAPTDPIDRQASTRPLQSL